VRSFSNLGLLSRSTVYESGYFEWDVDMVFEEPEAEPCLPSRSSPNDAACPAFGQPASSAFANRGAGFAASRMKVFNTTIIVSNTQHLTAHRTRMGWATEVLSTP
jgi:hypothetical protein